MSPMLPAQGLLELVDDAAGVELPQGIAETIEQVRAVITRCDKDGVPNETLLAAQMTELTPPLVHAYGPCGVASVLNQLVLDLAIAGPAQTTRQ